MTTNLLPGILAYGCSLLVVESERRACVIQHSRAAGANSRPEGPALEIWIPAARNFSGRSER